MSLLHDLAQNFKHMSLPPIYPPIQNAWPFTAIDHFAQVGTDPDFNNDFETIVTENGYVFENHPVTTEDGYVLNVYRIKKDNSNAVKPVVFLQHGITDTADCWIMQTKEKAPAFRLVEAGYDVWLGNQRGTKHSLNPGHTTLNPSKDEKYWEFSFVEMGDYDAPAQVDHVRKVTGQDKISYVGHSQGTTQMFYSISDRPDFWKERLNLFTALAPVTRLEYTKNDALKYLHGLATNWLMNAMYTVNIYELFGDDFSQTALHLVCGIAPGIC
jgi:pimeloyl-ACP methyl ester carboxylesterase